MSGDVRFDTPAFRAAMGSYCPGLTVVTARLADGTLAGMTCRSFHSLSLDPPLVAFFVGSASSSFARLRGGESFCINILSQRQHDLAMQFARSGTDKFAHVDWVPDSAGNPAISGSLAVLSCVPHAIHPGGDHLIVVARVTGFAHDMAAQPLLFFRSAFHRLPAVP